MNSLELKLKELNPNLFGKLNETKQEVKLLLNEYNKNFPDYTDHSIHHTEEVYNIVSEVLTEDEVNNLNDDEIYILSMASYLHDIGMCIPENKISEITDTEELIKERELHPEISREKYLRDIHHTLSKKFILEEWKSLKIPTIEYAEAIALVSEGHRIVDIGNPEIYNPKFIVKSGRTFVCLPYLAAVLRIADELDITNIRTPSLLTKYYMPDNEKSVLEWNKHIATSLRFITENYVEFKVNCSNHSMLAALEDQFNKIRNVINYCQKVIRNISNTENRKFSLKLEQVRNKITYVDFDPKGIKYSFDVENVINAFVGENLYNDKLTSLRELLQNSIDTCRYKKVLNPNYTPEINITIDDKSIKIEDNGLGMDEFIIKNYFGKLGSSFYQQESVKKDYEAIGQFGVGVFSYFLMADYIDIETKTKESETLHFRLDKDPKNYFHFFKNHTRNKSGTTITLNLKKECSKYSINDYVDYLKDKFRQIEFPISIINKEDKFDIISQGFEDKNLKQKFTDSLKLKYKNLTNDFEIFVYNFSNDEYEGSVSFPYLKNLSFENINRFLNSDLQINNIPSRLILCQKGVLISKNNDYERFYLNINFKQKIEIEISRNDFSRKSKIKEILYEVSSHLILILFSKLSYNNKPKRLAELTFNLIKNLDIKYKKDMYSMLFFKFYNNRNKQTYINFENLLKKEINRIVISLNKANTNILFNKISNNQIIELCFEEDIYYYNFSSVLYLFSNNNYTEVIVKENEIYYIELNKDYQKTSSVSYFNVYSNTIHTRGIDKIIIDKNYCLLEHYKKYNYSDIGFNSINNNHPFIIEISNYEISQINQKTRVLIKEIFEALANYYPNNLKNIFHLEKEIKKNIVINYQLSKKDFPEIQA